jgi:preprotein translocase subunit Sec63
MTKKLMNNAFENFVNIQYFVFISESLNIFHYKINCLDYSMEKTKETYLNILEVNSSSTLEDLKKAYKRLALKWHPDKHSNNKHFAQ